MESYSDELYILNDVIEMTLNRMKGTLAMRIYRDQTYIDLGVMFTETAFETGTWYMGASLEIAGDVIQLVNKPLEYDP